MESKNKLQNWNQFNENKSTDDKKIVENKEEDSIENEADFKEYAHKILKEAHGDEYKKEKAEETIKDIIAKHVDYGNAIGVLQNSLGD